MKIETLLAHLVQMGGSDLHLKSGALLWFAWTGRSLPSSSLP